MECMPVICRVMPLRMVVCECRTNWRLLFTRRSMSAHRSLFLEELRAAASLINTDASQCGDHGRGPGKTWGRSTGRGHVFMIRARSTRSPSRTGTPVIRIELGELDPPKLRTLFGVFLNVRARGLGSA